MGLGLLMAVYSVMQFIFAPIWGGLSDRYGRKRILLLGVFGNALSLFLMGLASSYWTLLAARSLAGILSSATLPTAMAFIGDSTSEADRGGGMGIVGAAMGVGMVIGPGLGGWLASASLSMPFYLAAALSVAALLLIAAILPESLPEDQRVQGVSLAGPQLAELRKALVGPLGFLFLMAFMVSFAMTSFEGVFGLYALRRFDYGPERVGTIMTVIGVISAVIQGVLTGPATRRWGEGQVIKASLIGSVIGFGLMLLAFDFATVLITVGFFVVNNTMLRPAISALISKGARSGQGVAMGLNNSFMSLGRIAGPLWAGALFDVNISLPYLSGAVVLAIVYGVSLFKLTLPRFRPADPANAPEAVGQRWMS